MPMAAACNSYSGKQNREIIHKNLSNSLKISLLTLREKPKACEKQMILAVRNG